MSSCLTGPAAAAEGPAVRLSAAAHHDAADGRAATGRTSVLPTRTGDQTAHRPARPAAVASPFVCQPAPPRTPAAAGRRLFLTAASGVLATTVAGGLTGCVGDGRPGPGDPTDRRSERPTPRPDPDLATLQAALAAKERLLERTRAADVQSDPLLGQLAGHHELHAARFAAAVAAAADGPLPTPLPTSPPARPSPTPTSPTGTTPSGEPGDAATPGGEATPVSVEALVRLYRAVARQRAAQVRAVRSGAVARLLTAVGAAEAAHLVLLDPDTDAEATDDG